MLVDTPRAMGMVCNLHRGAGGRRWRPRRSGTVDSRRACGAIGVVLLVGSTNVIGCRPTGGCGLGGAGDISARPVSVAEELRASVERPGGLVHPPHR